MLNPDIEFKLNTFEKLIAELKEKPLSGQSMIEQIDVLNETLASLMAQHTIAGWWCDEMLEKISALRQNYQWIDFKFTQEFRLKNATPKLIEDFKFLKPEKPNEIPHRITDETEPDNINYTWFCGGINNGKTFRTDNGIFRRREHS